MKKLILLLLVFLVLLAAVKAEETATVTKVIDGDTIQLENGSKVRLIGIDTPERGDCYYKEAKIRLQQLVLNKEVILEKDITEKDKYNRLLRYVYLEDISVNDIMVKEGYAIAYYYYPDVSYYDRFKLSEKLAKNTKAGLWIDCEQDNPSIFLEMLDALFKMLSIA